MTLTEKKIKVWKAEATACKNWRLNKWLRKVVVLSDELLVSRELQEKNYIEGYDDAVHDVELDY